MDIDQILQAMNDHEVAYLLIGGMNHLLRHEPVLTFDVDLWIEDDEANRRRCEHALASLAAQWGESGGRLGARCRTARWLAGSASGVLPEQPARRHRHLSSRCGPVRLVRLPGECRARRNRRRNTYWGLSDEDMLRCQLALDEPYRKTSTDRNLGACPAIAEQRSWKCLTCCSREEQKRWRQWDAAERWRVILQTINWAERQATVQRNTPAACLREQQA